MIVHWPAAVPHHHEPVTALLHVIDVSPTLLAIAGDANGISGNDSGPEPPGKSFADHLLGNPSDDPPCRTLWWQHEGNRALRIGDWKLVASGRQGAWELYDLQTDRTETNDLSQREPERVRAMAARWEAIRAENQSAALSLE
jgi:arylsulfatase